MFVSDTLYLCDVEWWNACDLCMHACLLLLFLLPAIESNDTECNEEGEVYEYQEEEDQGLANQEKPSILDTYLMWGPQNTRYAYNSQSHDQCVVNPHIRVDNRITSSITITELYTYNWSHDQVWYCHAGQVYNQAADTKQHW
jgi:hypothetical protein